MRQYERAHAIIGRILLVLGLSSCATLPPPAPTQRPTTEGCADGTLEELLDVTRFPNVAACSGTWTGSVDRAGNLCAEGWHVCTGEESQVRTMQYGQVVLAKGCFAFDAAQDYDTCHVGCSTAVAAGIDSAERIDMAGFGGDCKWKFQGAGSCIAGGRVDASKNSGTGCGFDPSLSGVLCCRAASPP
jgi:hypothetical protein